MPIDFNLLRQAYKPAQIDGSVVDQAIAQSQQQWQQRQQLRLQNQQAIRAEEAHQRQMDYYALQEAKDVQNQLGHFAINPETPSPSLNAILSKPGRELADQYNANFKAFKDGDMDETEYAQAQANLQNQVGLIKQGISTFTEDATNYWSLYDQGQISAANDDSLEGYFRTLRDNAGSLNIGVDPETGVVTVKGFVDGTQTEENPDGEPINIPFDQLDKRPKIIKRAENPNQAITGIVAQAVQLGRSGGQNFWNNEDGTSGEVQQSVVSQLSNMVDAADDSTLLSYAVDYLGIDKKVAKEALAQRDETGANSLEKMVLDGFTQSAEKIHVGATQQQQAQQVAKPTAQQQNEASLRQDNSVRWNDFARNAAKTGAVDYSFLEGGRTLSGQTIWGIKPVQVDAPGWFTGDRTEWWINVGNKEIKLPDDPNQRNRYIMNLLGVKAAGGGGSDEDYGSVVGSPQNEPSTPFNRMMDSPLYNRSRGARKAAQNAARKAQIEEETRRHWDELREGEKVGWGDVAYKAAGAIPVVGGVLAAKDIAEGAASLLPIGSDEAEVAREVATEEAQQLAEGLGSGVWDDAATVAKAGGKSLTKVAGKAAKYGTKGVKAAKLAKKAGSKAAKGLLKGAAGTAAKAIGGAGAVYALGEAAKAYNKMAAQNMTDEEYARHRSRKSGRAASRQRDLARRNPYNN